jgi:hypothetical protein
MQWSNYITLVGYTDREFHAQPKPFIVRAVSCKHALTKAQKQHPDAQSHEVIKCRCSEINNDMCEAHYEYWRGQ